MIKKENHHWVFKSIIAAAVVLLVASVATGGLWKAFKQPEPILITQSQMMLKAAPESADKAVRELSRAAARAAAEAEKTKIEKLQLAQAWSDLIVGNIEKLLEIVLGIAGVIGLLRTKKGTRAK